MGTQQDELKERVEAKKKRVEARIHELKADGSAESREKADAMSAKLDEVKQTVATGYEDMKEGAAAKLNSWLKEEDSSGG
ncbi:MAG: hypothetical protein ACF8Q5_08925 [Phycisphaerales bacterium JB040]